MNETISSISSGAHAGDPDPHFEHTKINVPTFLRTRRCRSVTYFYIVMQRIRIRKPPTKRAWKAWQSRAAFCIRVQCAWERKRERDGGAQVREECRNFAEMTIVPLFLSDGAAICVSSPPPQSISVGRRRDVNQIITQWRRESGWVLLLLLPVISRRILNVISKREVKGHPEATDIIW